MRRALRYPSPMLDELDPLAAERQFFAALAAADVQGLDRTLADDFLG